MDNLLIQYKRAHWWMIIPIIIILVGFMPSYFLTFTTEPWGHHMHALTAIAWFVLLIIQPYLATRKNFKKHRLYGMIGLFIAGAVVFSALTISPSNIYYAEQGGFPPFFPGAFFYGIIFTETLAIIGFATAVIMAIINAKNYEEHAIWMTSTAFFGLMPAWGRMAMLPVFVFELDYTQSDVMKIAVPIFLAVVFYVGYKLKKLKHPAIILSALINLTMLFIIPIGESEFFQKFITALMKPLVGN